jgi:hypothetical protein
MIDHQGLQMSNVLLGVTEDVDILGLVQHGIQGGPGVIEKGARAGPPRGVIPELMKLQARPNDLS